MSKIYKAKVVDNLDAEDCVMVVFSGGSTNAHKVKTIKKHANPLYGETGELPDIGEEGIVLQPDEGIPDYYWVGSIPNYVENIGTTETQKKHVHHFSDVWYQLHSNGDVEFSHPSGSYIKIGGTTTLSSLTRWVRQPNMLTLKQQIPYNLRTTPATNMFINHTWTTTAQTASTCSYDNRKQTYTAPTNSTQILLDPNGNVTVTHNSAGGILTIHLDPAGNMTLNIPQNVTATIGSNKTENITNNYSETCAVKSITANSSISLSAPTINITASSSASVTAPAINIGGSSEPLRSLIDNRLLDLFNNHVHPDPQGGNTGVPTTPLTQSNTCTSIMQGG